jgi:hypothetical protein
LERERQVDKLKKKRKGYEAKKAKKAEEVTWELRQKTGVFGFSALYKVLELPERRLATAAEIKKAYHKMSLKWHPDKHPDNQEEAQERFLEIKSAFEVLQEGLRTGSIEGHAVGSAGALMGKPTDAQVRRSFRPFPCCLKSHSMPTAVFLVTQ